MAEYKKKKKAKVKAKKTESAWADPSPVEQQQFTREMKKRAKEGDKGARQFLEMQRRQNMEKVGSWRTGAAKKKVKAKKKK
jgi:hypothetical protein